MPEHSLIGIISRTAYWVEWWRRFGPASGNEPKLKDLLDLHLQILIAQFTHGRLTLTLLRRPIRRRRQIQGRADRFDTEPVPMRVNELDQRGSFGSSSLAK
jgi:hypothetical protein